MIIGARSGSNASDALRSSRQLLGTRPGDVSGVSTGSGAPAHREAVPRFTSQVALGGDNSPRESFTVAAAQMSPATSQRCRQWSVSTKKLLTINPTQRPSSGTDEIPNVDARERRFHTRG